MSLDDRIRAYAQQHGLTLTAAKAQLCTIALDHLEATARAGRARHEGTTAAERSALARRAGEARWARHRQQKS